MSVQAVDDTAAQPLATVVPCNKDGRQDQDRDSYRHADRCLVHGCSLVTSCYAHENTSFGRILIGLTSANLCCHALAATYFLTAAWHKARQKKTPARGGQIGPPTCADQGPVRAWRHPARVPSKRMCDVRLSVEHSST